ncbi:hypothetical protein VTO73DRAFT_3549 [Trametes versicolor]
MQPPTGKRRHEDISSDSSPSAKHRRTASGSDFSTYDIKYALDMPLPPAPHGPPPQPPQPPLPVPSRTADLPELLDFSALESQQDISARFELLASELLHNYRLEVTHEKKIEHLEILELEFYLYKSGSHEDPFTHASAEQSQAGRWYFHRPPRRTNDPVPQGAAPMGYRGGTRKGMDITIGAPPPTVTSKYFLPANPGEASSSAAENAVLRGGVLLRSIRRASDSKVISGPSLLVDELLRLSGASEIAELVALHWDGDISALPPSPNLIPSRDSTMWLRRTPPAPPSVSSKPAPTPPRIFRSPRIGLDISHPSIAPPTALTHPRVVYVARPYRFFTHPHLLTANGRGQTFLGVYDALEARGHCTNDEELLGELVRLTGVKGPTAKNYLAALRAGLGAGMLEEWIGPKGKKVLSSVTEWLKMAGTLRRLQAAAESSTASGSGTTA